MLNDLFRTYKKIIAVVVLLICGILFWFFGCYRSARDEVEQTGWVQASEDVQNYDFYTPQIKGSITFGTEGRLSSERTQPVILNIAGTGDSFTGTVKITLPGDEGKGVAYQSAVQCAKGYSSKIVFSVPHLGDVSFFSVEILDQYGTEELARMIVGANGLCGDMDSGSGEVSDKKLVLIGVLTDDPDQLQWLNGLEIKSNQDTLLFSFLKLKEQDLWCGGAGLGSLSGILIDNYDTNKLSSTQKRCIQEWVEKKGGSLMLGTGVRADEVLGGIVDLVGAKAGETKEESLQFYDDEESAGYLTVLTNRLKIGKVSNYKAEGISFPISCYLRKCGEGKIMLMTWSFTDNAISQWSGKEKMAQEILEDAVPKIIQPGSADEDSTWYLKKALYSYLAPRASGTFYYALFFIGYIFTLVFFSYYLLRRTKRSEYIWLVVPVVSIVFTFLLFIRTGVFGNDTASTYSAVEISDADKGMNDVYFLYQNNEGESNHVDLTQNVTSVLPMDYSYRSDVVDVASLRRLRQDFTINNAQKGFDIAFEEAVPGTSRILQMEKTKAEDDQASCFDLKLQADDASFQGTITNRSHWYFSSVILIRGYQYILLDDLEAGETRKISAVDIRCWSGFEQENSAYLEEEREDLSGLMDYIRYRYMNGAENYNTIIAAGITDERDIPLLTDQEMLQNQQTVFVSRYPLPSKPGLHYIANINRQCLGSDNADSSLARDILEEKKTKAVYQFDRDKIVACAIRNKDSFEGSIYAYNYNTGNDDLIFKDKNTVYDGEKLEPYLSEMNKMILTYRMNKDEDYGPAPLLTFVMKEEK